MRALYRILPGPAPLRVLGVLLVAAVAVALTLLLYEWVGTAFLDSGGTIG